jgi:hypothetical protein
VGEVVWGGCWFLWPLCVFVGISTVVVEGACIRDCRGLRVCTVGTVASSVGGECAGQRDSVVTGKDRE